VLAKEETARFRRADTTALSFDNRDSISEERSCIGKAPLCESNLADCGEADSDIQ
jgi:hypothetical protein